MPNEYLDNEITRAKGSVVRVQADIRDRRAVLAGTVIEDEKETYTRLLNESLEEEKQVKAYLEKLEAKKKGPTTPEANPTK